MQAINGNRQNLDRYAILGLADNIPLTTHMLIVAYRKAALRYHPDKNLGNVVANDMMKLVSDAKDALEPLAERGGFVLADEIAREEAERVAQEQCVQPDREDQPDREEREREERVREANHLYQEARNEKRKQQQSERRDKLEHELEDYLAKHATSRKNWLEKRSAEIADRQNKKMKEKGDKINSILLESRRAYEERLAGFDVEIAEIKGLYDMAVSDYEIAFKSYEQEKKTNPRARPPKEIPSWDVPLEKWEKRRRNFVAHHESEGKFKFDEIEKEYEEDEILTSSEKLPDGWEIRKPKNGEIYYFEPITELRIKKGEKHKLHFYR